MQPFLFSRFISLISGLAGTPGPSLSEGPRREALCRILEESAIAYEVDSAGNVHVDFGTGEWSQSVVFDAHIDVVEKGYADTVARSGNIITGMGLGDNLTAVTMLVLLAESLKKSGQRLTRPLKLLFSTGEEGVGNLKGVRQLVADRKTAPHLFVAFDLSFDEYSVAALGSARFRISVNCGGGHSWDDFGAPSAVHEMISLLGTVRRRFDIVSEKNIGRVSFNIGTLKGGEGINSIARNSEATLEFRSVSPDVLDECKAMLYDALEEFRRGENLSVDCETIGERPAAEQAGTEKIVPIIKNILEKEGIKPVETIRSTNINIPLSQKWPSLCMGLCRCGNYHREDEYIEADSLETGWRILNMLTLAFVGEERICSSIS